MIIYVRFEHEGDPVSFFWGLKAITKTTQAKDLYDDLLNGLLVRDGRMNGLTEECLRERWIGFPSDGAKNFVGENGVAGQIKQNFPLVQTFHCVAHRLQLVVLDSIK